MTSRRERLSRPPDTGFHGGGALDDEADSELVRQFVGLADALFESGTERGVLDVVERVIAAACAIVPGAEMVTVMLRSGDGEFETVAGNGEPAERADRIQIEEGDGPSYAASYRHDIGVALSSELLDDPRWQSAAPRLHHELGVRSVLATGMFPGGDPPRFGVLTFYSTTSGGLDAADRDHALVLAAHAATAISAGEARSGAELRETQLREALRSRDVIGQAKGILMERRGYSAEDAFDVLRRTSQELNVKLREVAETLVNRRSEL